MGEAGAGDSQGGDQEGGDKGGGEETEKDAGSVYLADLL